MFNKQNRGNGDLFIMGGGTFRTGGIEIIPLAMMGAGAAPGTN